MAGFAASLLQAATGAMSVLACALPLAAHASEVTFDWVPISENPVSAQSTSASGSLTIDLSGWTQTDPHDPPDFGPYYSSGSAVTGAITAFSFLSANGQSAELADLPSTTAGAPPGQSATLWATSAIDTPASGPQTPSAPAAGHYLVTQFSVSGDTADGTPFMIGNNAGTAGATYPNGIPNADVSFNADGASAAIANGGHWELAASPVPLPAGLPLLLGGLAIVGWFAHRRGHLVSLAAHAAP